MENYEFETTSFMRNDDKQEKGNVENGKEDAVEANEFLKNELKGLNFYQRFKLTKNNWFSVTLDLKYFKRLLTLVAFYKLLLLFGTR